MRPKGIDSATGRSPYHTNLPLLWRIAPEGFVHLAFVAAEAAVTTAERLMMAMIIAIGRIAALVSLRLSDYDRRG